MTEHYRPHMIPKLRSEEYLRAVAGLGVCTLRVASYIGEPCAPASTCVACHLSGLGKGMSTKVTDFAVACGCHTCHDLIDQRDSRWKILADEYAAAVEYRMRLAMQETQGLLLDRGVIALNVNNWRRTK